MLFTLLNRPIIDNSLRWPPTFFKLMLAPLLNCWNTHENVGPKGFLLASTGSVYAPYEGSLLEANDVNPMDFYSASKIAAEKLCAAYESNFSIAKMRLFFPYGEQQQDKLIVNLIENLKKGKPVQINGPDGGMKLTPTYIADICSIFRQSILENLEWLFQHCH